MNTLRKTHILYWIYDAKKWLIILTFPIIRAVFFKQPILSLITASVRDIGIALILISYSFMKWNMTTYSLENGLKYKHGMFFRRTLYLPTKDAASTIVEKTPLMWLTKGKRVSINTAGIKSKSDATLYLPEKIIVTPIIKKNKVKGTFYSVRFLPILILCASSSNAAVGLLTAAPALRRASKMLGSLFTDNINRIQNIFEHIISVRVPPILDTAANLFILGWGFSFVTTFLKTVRFHAQKTDSQLYVSSGLLSRREIYIDTMKITALELRQSLFMKIFNLQTASITAAGYGREKDGKPIIIPSAKPKDLKRALNLLLPNYPESKIGIKPRKQSFFIYLYRPLILIGIGFLPYIFLGSVWIMLTAIVSGIGIWWLSVSLINFFRVGIGINDKAVTMKYARKLAFYKAQIPIEVVDCVIITQSPFQKISGSCNLKIECFTEKRRRHFIKALPYKECIKLSEKYLLYQ